MQKGVELTRIFHSLQHVARLANKKQIPDLSCKRAWCLGVAAIKIRGWLTSGGNVPTVDGYW